MQMDFFKAILICMLQKSFAYEKKNLIKRQNFDWGIQ
jgi:hypothetical protein